MTAENCMSQNIPLHYRFFENKQLIGFVEYYLFDEVVIVTHTEVNSALEGKGHGSRLANEALAFFFDHEKQVVPVCGFFAQHLRKNQQFAHCVTPESRKIFDIHLPEPK